MDARAGRQAKNEALLRAVNREIENISEQLGDRDLEVVCECGRHGCAGVIEVRADVYDRVHRQRDRFLVLPGHQTPEIERIVEVTDDYVVVDKFGEAEDVVERQDSGD